MITVKKAIWITLGSIAGVFVLLAVIGGILAAHGRTRTAYISTSATGDQPQRQLPWRLQLHPRQ